MEQTLLGMQVQGERHHWDAVWVKAEEVIREGILVSPNMATDHYAMTLQVEQTNSVLITLETFAIHMPDIAFQKGSAV